MISRTIRAVIFYLFVEHTMRASFIRFSWAAIPLSILLSASLHSPKAQAEVSLDLGISNKYLREGISQTGNSFTYNAGLNWMHNSGFYSGVWGSRIDRDEDELKFESDIYAGFYQPINESIALDTTLTRYQFHGDSQSFYQDYNELGVSLLLKDRFKLGWRGSNDYLDTDHSWRTLDMSYVFPIKDFNVEVYLANYRWLSKDNDIGAHYDSKSHYWHFRIGVERTWNNWDYRLAFERSIVGGRYDGGSNFIFGINRHFKLMQ